MDTPETRKHHRKKQKLQSLQEEVDNILVQRPESASQLKETETVANTSFNGEVKNNVQGQQRVLPKHLHKIGSPSSVSSAPFSATEELIWDWQAVALALAVFACLLFFVVACVYTVHHARQWRRLKDNFEDFEAG
jgi:Flp pilus assembly protein TadB